jgi:hypothetical protein
MAITKWDEYLIHQMYDTMDKGEVDVDRLYLACHDADGTLHLAVGMGVYPKANIMDGYACVRHRNVQHNLRLSRHLQGDRSDTRIGPLLIDVIEPLKRWGAYLNDNEHVDVRFEMEFVGRGAPFLSRSSLIPFVHYNQPGRCKGSIVIDGQRKDLNGFLGARDRSWRMQLSPQPGMIWLGHFWIMAQFPDCWLSLHGVPLWEGFPPDFHAALVYDNGQVVPIREVRHRVALMPTVRALTGIELLLTDDEGLKRHVVATPKSPALYIGGGADYERQGQDKGSNSIEGERWHLSQPADDGSRPFGSLGMSEYIADFQLDGTGGVGIFEISYCPDTTREYKPTW